MADRRTLKEIVAVVETEIKNIREIEMAHIKTNLRNIDGNLEKLNTRTSENEKAIARIYGIGAGFVALASLAAFVMWLLGVF